ncbi:MAG: cobalt ECF transporter T component CbiQ [Angustibacter sp.]
MGGAHQHGRGGHTTTGQLYRAGDTALHRCPAQAKLVAAVCFVLVVVATPRDQVWAFGGHAALLATACAVARLPVAWVARRALIEVPFVVFAVLLPFTGPPPDVELLGVEVSRSGLLSGWNVLAKGTLGVVTSIVLAATTTVPDLLAGLQRLRVPALLVQIASFMVRYLDVVADQVRRMRLARISRGHDPRFLWQAAVLARTAGALFIRSFERGERVYLAMISRGYTGSLPMTGQRDVAPVEWLVVLAWPAMAAILMGWAWIRT